MSMPFYVSPEQVMKDRADYARKGIARGRSLVAVACAEGVVICAENPSNTLRKVSEIYDRIAFAGVGKYNEFDQLRISGVRAADLKGYSFSREDVDARGLANQYAQILGQVFTHEMKPLEVEILVAEVGTDADGDRLFHLLYDGTVIDETGSAVLGGDAEAVAERLASALPTPNGHTLGLDEALRAAIGALAGPERTLSPADVEVALLDRDGLRRCFRRLSDDELTALLGPADEATESEAAPQDRTPDTEPESPPRRPRPAQQAPAGPDDLASRLPHPHRHQPRPR